MKKNESARIKARKFKNLLNHILCILFPLFIQTSFAAEEGKVTNRLSGLLSHQLNLESDSQHPELTSITVISSSTARVAKPSATLTPPGNSSKEQASDSRSKYPFVKELLDKHEILHIEAVNSDYIQAIIKRKISHQSYAHVQYALQSIYQIIEEAESHSELPEVIALVHQLKRNLSKDDLTPFVSKVKTIALQFNEPLQKYIATVQTLKRIPYVFWPILMSSMVAIWREVR